MLLVTLLLMGADENPVQFQPDPSFSSYISIPTRGFQFYVRPLVAKDKALYENVRKSIKRNIDDIYETVPARLVSIFRQARVFIELDKRSIGTDGAVYISKAGHISHVVNAAINEKNIPQKFNSIEYRNARDFSNSNSEMLLHELGHAFHAHLPGGFENAYVKEVFGIAKARKIYKPDDYCMNNEREYFADLTSVYFCKPGQRAGRTDPKTKEWLQENDPQGYMMIQKVYGVSDPKENKPKPKSSGKRK